MQSQFDARDRDTAKLLQVIYEINSRLVQISTVSADGIACIYPAMGIYLGLICVSLLSLCISSPSLPAPTSSDTKI